MKLTLEVNKKGLLDTIIESQNNILITLVHRKDTKSPTPWNSEVPKRYTHNVIIADLNRLKEISSDFTK